MRKIILASASPRRREILKSTGIKFIVDHADCDESLHSFKDPHNLAREISERKALAIANKHDDALIIAADTFIVFKNELMGKPHTDKEALRMLSQLNGKKHSVITGFSVLDTAKQKITSGTVETTVFFNKMTDDELKAYVKTGEPLDKAGAYAIQGRGAFLIKKIEGDYLNVVGLPLWELFKTLKKIGITIQNTGI
ncbi:MAG: septum formation inhibitor Maf [Nitrospirae bacterium]|nr:septum formation inhibitor Maf [Nitrospirota bacterium]